MTSCSGKTRTWPPSLRPGDGQRIVRALEVLQASGRSIRQWQSERGSPLVDRSSAHLIVIEPQRPLLIERIEARFARMVVDGAMAEVEALLALPLDPALPALKAIGVRELGHGDRRAGPRWRRRRSWHRSRRANMPSGSRHGSATSWVRNGKGWLPFILIFQFG